MKPQTKILVPLMLALTTLLLFQNCGGMGGFRTAQGKAETLASLSLKSSDIRQRKCSSCHEGSGTTHDPYHIMDDQYLLSRRWVIPGEPSQSPLYNSLFTGMPKNQPRLSDEEIDVIGRWIRALGTTQLRPAQLTLSDATVFDYGTAASGSTAEHAFTMSNSGEISALGIMGTGLSSPFAFKGGTFPGTGGTCLTVLPAGASCTILVTFSPSATGSFTDTIEIGYDSGAGVQRATRDVRGTGAGAALASLALSDSPTYNFGIVRVGGTAVEKTFTLTNGGSASATAISAGALGNGFNFKGGNFPGSGGTCVGTLNAGATCTIVITFLPAANGLQASNLSVSYNDAATLRTLSVALSGTGAGAGNMVYYSQIRSILNASSCNNCHGAPATDNWGTTYSALLAFKVTPNTTPSIQPSQANSRFIKRISESAAGLPQMGVAPYGNLTPADRQKIIDWIILGAPNDPPAAPASLTIGDGPTYNFGTVTTGNTAEHIFAVSNSGGQAATTLSGGGLAAPFAFKGGSFPGTGGTCATSLNAGASCTLVVTFRPSAAAAASDTIELTYNNGNSTVTVTRPISGTGSGQARATLNLSDGPTFNFGAVLIGARGSKTFTLTNSGSGPAQALTGSALANGFVYRGEAFPGGGTCSGTLNASTSCTIVVEFAPASAGPKTGAVSVNYNDGASAQTVSVNLQGLGVNGSNSTDPIYYSTVANILSQKCMNCHAGEFDTRAKLLAFKRAPNTTSSIVVGSIPLSRFATRVLGDMGDTGGLTADERATILGWIANGALNDPAGTVTQSFRVIQGDRYYLNSVLQKVYGTDVVTVKNYTDQILHRVDLYGGACHIQDTNYVGAARVKTVPLADRCLQLSTPETRMNPDVMPVASTISESVRMSTCMRIANSIGTTTVALNGSGLTSASPFTSDNVKKAYQRFYPGVEPSATVLDRLAAIGNTANTASGIMVSPGQTRVVEGWRYIYMAVCLSPGWQAP